MMETLPQGELTEFNPATLTREALLLMVTFPFIVVSELKPVKLVSKGQFFISRPEIVASEFNPESSVKTALSVILIVPAPVLANVVNPEISGSKSLLATYKPPSEKVSPFRPEMLTRDGLLVKISAPKVIEVSAFRLGMFSNNGLGPIRTGPFTVLNEFNPLRVVRLLLLNIKRPLSIIDTAFKPSRLVISEPLI
jgi:hypothetical protein